MLSHKRRFIGSVTRLFYNTITVKLRQVVGKPVVRKMVPSVKLNDGVEFPVLGMGTSQAQPGELEKAVKDAIDIGYRHFDTAQIYNNEHEVGAAVNAKIKEGTVKRKDIFITTKLWNTFHRPDLVIPACKKSLENMSLDYIDLYLIHFPVAQKDGWEQWPKDEQEKLIESDADYVETWKQMEECVTQGLVKTIGVSNFNSEQLTNILNIAKIKPAVNQVECHPYLNQSKLLKFCKEREILLMAYAPFGRPGSNAPTMKTDVPSLFEDSVLKDIAEKHKKSIPQVILRYLVQHGVLPIPKSTNKNRLQENIDVFDFELSSEHVVAIGALNEDNRIFTYPMYVSFKEYPFNIEF